MVRSFHNTVSLLLSAVIDADFVSGRYLTSNYYKKKTDTADHTLFPNTSESVVKKRSHTHVRKLNMLLMFVP